MARSLLSYVSTALISRSHLDVRAGKRHLSGAAPPATHHTILAIDVEKFGDLRRTRPHQVAMRRSLYRALHEALARSSVPWSACYHEDRGAGALILVAAEVPKGPLVTALPTALADVLRKHNASADARARIRVRLALHAGEVQPDDHGVVGGWAPREWARRRWRCNGPTESGTASRMGSCMRTCRITTIAPAGTRGGPRQVSPCAGRSCGGEAIW
jgi:hypothetical protein